MLGLEKGKLGDEQRWFVGNTPKAKIFANDTWVKWGFHGLNENSDDGDTGDEPHDWKRVSGHQVSILIEGKIAIWAERSHPGDEDRPPIELTEKSEWVAIPDGWYHMWRVREAETLVITVRWKPDLIDVSRDMRALFAGK